MAVGCGGTEGASGSGSTGASDAGAGPPSASALSGISLSQTDVHIPSGTTTAFAVTALYKDGTRSDVSGAAQVSSSNTSVATVAHGQGAQVLITAVGAGTAVVTVTYGGFTQTCAVTVAQAGPSQGVTRITITGADDHAERDRAQQLHAIATFNDNHTEDVTNSAAWGSDNVNVATVSSTGLLQPRSPGSATITAAYAGVNGSITIQVR